VIELKFLFDPKKDQGSAAKGRKLAQTSCSTPGTSLNFPPELQME
jgi:hypothetical protein